MIKRVKSMYITHITSHNFENGDYKNKIIRDGITLERIKQEILGLDGNKKTCVTMGPDEDNPDELLMIAGGENGLYMVVLTYDNETFYTLIDSTKDKNDYIEMIVAGQTGEYPEYQFVRLGKVLRAAEYYATYGKKLEDLEWECT